MIEAGYSKEICTLHVKVCPLHSVVPFPILPLRIKFTPEIALDTWTLDSDSERMELLSPPPPISRSVSQNRFFFFLLFIMQALSGVQICACHITHSAHVWKRKSYVEPHKHKPMPPRGVRPWGNRVRSSRGHRNWFFNFPNRCCMPDSR